MSAGSVETISAHQNLKVDREGAVARVVLNRPSRRNALSLDLMQEMIEHLSVIARDPEVHAIILGAEGNVFCAGHDLAEMVGKNINEYRHIFDTCTELMTKIQSVP